MDPLWATPSFKLSMLLAGAAEGLFPFGWVEHSIWFDWERHFWLRARASWAVPGLVALKYFAPLGSRDRGRLGLSVPNWPAEVATSADSKGLCGGEAPPPAKKAETVF